MLYLDTARLGRPTPSAMRALADWVDFSAEQPGSLHADRLLRDGHDAWPGRLRRRFPGLASYPGARALVGEARALLFGDALALGLTSRSCSGMRWAARRLAERCGRVLVTDLGWPPYQRMVRRAVREAGGETTEVPLRQPVLKQQTDADGVVARLVEAFSRHSCDGCFLPLVSSDGVRLPVENLLQHLRADGVLRGGVLDAAQALGHVDCRAAARTADCLVGSCQKWLGAGQPIGLVAATEPTEATPGDPSPRKLCRVPDPLSRFVRELAGDPRAGVGETVNVTPLFGLAGALADLRGDAHDLDRRLAAQRRNADRLVEALPRGWKPLQPAPEMRSGVLLLAPSERAGFQPRALRARLLDHGVAGTAYSPGVVRLSMPATPWAPEELERLSSALWSVAGGSKGRTTRRRNRSAAVGTGA